MTTKHRERSYLVDIDDLAGSDRALILSDCREALSRLPDNCAALSHTSPPYNIGRSYRGFRDQQEMDEYSALVRTVFRELHRVTRPGGSVFWQVGYTVNGENGDSGVGGITALDCHSIPLAAEAGFVLWDRIIWSYYGSMAFQSKFTNRYETVLWLTKLDPTCRAPYFALDEVRERSKSYDGRNHLLGRNPGNVWEAERVAFGSTGQTSHIAVFPEEISEKIVRACSTRGDLVLDPFSGSGTLAKIALTTGRRFIGSEISEAYIHEADERLRLWRPSEVENLALGLLIRFGFGLQVGKRSKTSLAQSLGGYLSQGNVIRRQLRTLAKSAEEIRQAPRVTRALKDRKEELWREYDRLFGGADLANNVVAADLALGFCFAHRRRWNGIRRFLTAAEGLLQLQAVVDSAKSVEHYIDDLCAGADVRFRAVGKSIECMRADPGLGCAGDKPAIRSRGVSGAEEQSLFA